MVSPVVSTTSRVGRTSDFSDCVTKPGKLSLTPPGWSLARSATPLPGTSNLTTPLSGTMPRGNLDERLEEVRLEKMQVMEEVCDLLSDIPAAKMNDLFGLSAAHVQKKLAIRSAECN